MVDLRIAELIGQAAEELEMVRACDAEGDRFGAARHCGRASDLIAEIERLELMA